MDKDRALGLLIDLLADAAFEGWDVDAVRVFETMKKAGLFGCRPATEEDIEENDFGAEVGDDWYFLTDEAKALRKAAATPTHPAAGDE